MWSRLKLMFLMIIFMTLSAVAWEQVGEPNEYVEVQGLPEDLKKNPANKSQSAFLGLTDDVEQRLRDILNGEFRESWAAQFCFVPDPTDFRNDQMTIAIKNKTSGKRSFFEGTYNVLEWRRQSKGIAKQLADQIRDQDKKARSRRQQTTPNPDTAQAPRGIFFIVIISHLNFTIAFSVL